MALRGRLSGLAQPMYVLDIPGGAGKVPVATTWIADQDGRTVVTDPSGTTHIVPSGVERSAKYFSYGGLRWKSPLRSRTFRPHGKPEACRPPAMMV